MPDLSWPEKFRLRHGRAPRVLHIGNVANYAFTNAAMMRRCGVDADVIDPDSYHIMASPAWAEADVTGSWGDDFSPDWSRVNLHGYSVPEWFAQGPRDLVLAFAAARGKGDNAGASVVSASIVRATRRRARILGIARTADPFLRRARPLQRLARALARRWVYRTPAHFMKAQGKLQSTGVDAKRPSEAEELIQSVPQLSEVMGAYDVVQGYAVGALYGLAARHPAVVAYELGTLRGLPFEDSGPGRLCAWVYRSADAVMVTNSDCLDAADRLGIPSIKRFPVLHAFDTDFVVAQGLGASEPVRFPQPFFFAPARHHWASGSASFRKGNDLLIRAAAVLSSESPPFTLVFISWGEHVRESKALIRSLGLESRSLWLPPLSRKGLLGIYRSACAVIDQFSAAALGGIGLESLALGRRLITRYDPKAGMPFFSAPPPVLACETTEDIAAAIRCCLDDPNDEKKIGDQGRRWMLTEHSMRRQLAQQFAIYDRLTSESPSQCAS